MAYGVKSHKFCCCLPVRLGVFVLSFFELIITGAFAGISYYSIAQGRFDEQKYKIATIVTAAVMTLLFIVSLLGLIGCVLRRLPLVRIFSRTLNWLLAINIIAGIATTVLLFIANKQEVIDACKDGSTDQNVIDTCNHYNTHRYVIIALIVLGWAVQFYECVIVARYVIQLQEEKEEMWRLSAMKTYMQVPRRDSTDAFISPPVTYPYADKEHSFGSHRASEKV
ncbi:hypothetical protein ACEPAF_5487 [Sanghuangporus sanghuang]